MGAFQKDLESFERLNTQVLGVSVDSIYCHANWAMSLGGVSRLEAEAIRDSMLLAAGRLDLEPFGEGVHTADVRVEQVGGLERLAANLGIKIHTTATKTAMLEDVVHRAGGQIVVGGKLVGIPTQEGITDVGIDAAQCAGRPREQ